MEHAFAEAPLAVFTTLAPISGGAFVGLFLAFLFGKFNDKELRRLNILTSVPVAFALLGLIASFMHLANPFNALNVMNTFGTTPLANEILVFGIYFALMLIYYIMALAGALKSKLFRVLASGVVGCAGLVLAVFIGLAYLVPNIPAWDNGWTFCQVIGIELLGGPALTLWMVAMAKKNQPENFLPMSMVNAIVMVVGCILFVLGTSLIYGTGASLVSYLQDVTLMAEEALAPFIVSIVLAVVATVFGFLTVILSKKDPRPWAWVAIIVAIIAIFWGRIMFYALQINLYL